MFVRLAAFVAAVEMDEEKAYHFAEEFYRMLYDGYFLPGGRVIAGSGDLFRLKTLANCFVSVIEEDSIEGIYKAAYEAARTYSYGGGIGLDISVLRPKDTIVHNAADKSTGAVSFMELYSLTTGLIGQSGRRGALMLMIDVKHPDIIDFIRVKQESNWITRQIRQQCEWTGSFSKKQLALIEKAVRENVQVRFANISIKVTDEFLRAVEEHDLYENQFLVYKKFDNPLYMAYQEVGELHYSYGIPAKDLDNYEFIGAFSSLDELNSFLKKEYGVAVNSREFQNPYQRDVFGDYIIEKDEIKSPPEEKKPNYHLAIRKAGDFLLYFAQEQTGEIRKLVNARDIWNEFIAGNYRTAEPGMVFWDKIKKYSPSNYLGRPVASTNPCGEVPLEDGGACNLGSINLSRMVDEPYTENARINWDRLKKVTRLAIRFLDNVVSWNEYLNALEKQRKAAKETRRLGLGVMGIADMLNELGLAYDSDEGIKTIEKVMAFITNHAVQTSAELSEEKGPSPIFDFEQYKQCAFYKEALWEETKELIKQKGLRNIAVMSIAPTGTISNIVLSFVHGNKHYIGVSGGIEPIFALYYTRRSESFNNRIFKIFHSTVQAYLDINDLTTDAYAAEKIEDLYPLLPSHFFRTAHHISYKKRVQIQGVCQKYIDHSISSTINLPEDIHPETISDIYKEAWKRGLKGVTIYREGSRYPILSVDKKMTEFQKFQQQLFDVEDEKGNVYQLRGDSIIVLPNGKLTTLYHEYKAGKIKINNF